MTFSVVFTPEAEEQLVDLYRYIAAAGSPESAARYTDSIMAFCEELATFPYRGKARDDIGSGLPGNRLQATIGRCVRRYQRVRVDRWRLLWRPRLRGGSD